MLSIEDYLDKIKAYLSDMINDYKNKGKSKIHLTMAINFFSSKDSKERRTLHSNSKDIEIIIGYETDEIIEKRFDSLLQRYKKGLDESMKENEFIFGSVDLLYYKFYKIS